MAESTNVTMGYQDLPVGDLKDDLFNVESYVNGLCRFILNCDTPMTISIQGDWGSGKTSMMNMVKENLGEKVLPIWFNTWQFSQFQLEKSLAISMMEVMLKKIEDKSDNKEKLSEMIEELKKNLIVIATEMVTGSSTLGQILGKTYSSCVNEITELKEQFQDIVYNKLATRKNCDRMVVFIDDLDRLQPLKAIELLEVLKLFLDCKNCVFVLAIDYEVVTLGIRQKYGSDIDAAKGKSFFDKIIQLPFKMPVNQYDIDKYTESMMKKMKIIDDKENNVKLFSSLIKTSIGLNPRGMKRLFNAYQLLYSIMQPEETKYNYTQEVRTDILKQRILFAVVCMQMSFESVYDYLSKGNVDINALKNLESIDRESIDSFLRQRTISETISSEKLGDEDILSDEDILNAIFDNKISIEELSVTLQKLPNFIKYFIQAIHKGSSSEISKEELGYLRDILKHSTITDVKQDEGEATQQSIELRQKNRELAQRVNKALEKIGEFKIPQAQSPAYGIGYLDFTGKNDKIYQLRYVLKYTEKIGITISIYINGRNQNPEEFYKFMGKNPLKYNQNPVMNAQPGWYFYADIFKVNNSEKSDVEYIAETVTDAYNRLNDYIAKKS